MADRYSLSALHMESFGKSQQDSLNLSRTVAVGELDPLCSSSSIGKLHVVMVPYPIQGQINPMMQFAKLLTARDDDIMVTLVTNKHNYDCILRTRTAASTLRCLLNNVDAAAPILSTAAEPLNSKLHLTWVENGLPPDFNYSDLTGRAVEFRESLLHMKEPLKQLLQRLKQRSPRVSCVLLGTLCQWAASAASELGVPAFLFWTQSASVFSMYYHLPLLEANGFFPYNKGILSGCNENHVEKSCDHLVTYIPGLPPLQPASFPSWLHVDTSADPSLAHVQDQFSIVGSYNGVIINSFDKLEKETWQALQQELPYPVSLVGPLLPSAFLDGNDPTDKTTGASLLQETNDCIKWLDGKNKHSVLYISFGSLFNPSAAERESIATAIKASRQPYLWVVRPNSFSRDVSEIFPTGFVEETKEFGLLIPWAPQVQVLSHSSVGAFLTHCGWNSTLESLSMGIPMICFPILVDQPTNSTYVCDVWKVGMALKRQGDASVKSEEVEKVLRRVLQEEEGAQMRERAMKLRDAARQAVRVQGSSYAHIEEFLQGLRNLRQPHYVPAIHDAAN